VAERAVGSAEVAPGGGGSRRRLRLAEVPLAQTDAAGRAALQLQRAFQDGICIALSLELLSWLECDERTDGAAELAGGAAAVWRLLGTTIDAFGPHITVDSMSMAEAIDRKLGRSEAGRLHARQGDLGKLDAVELALGGRRRETAVRARGKAPLTRREFEVALLIAEGLSNRAIADRLVISTRTVDGHVERILAKLEYSSRTQVATWALTRDEPLRVLPPRDRRIDPAG
jgi:DNA-binding CsgD family transcriptional regulator